MKKKTISLRGISEILNEKELKSVMGGTYSNWGNYYSNLSCCTIFCNDGIAAGSGSPCPEEYAYIMCHGNFGSSGSSIEFYCD